MKQRTDIDPATTWVTSDTHFGHENIVGFCDRPADHEQIMIDRWNEEVPANATVLHCGDLSYRGNAYFRSIIAPKLNGSRKVLTPGNHDKSSATLYRVAGFERIRPFYIEYGEARTVLNLVDGKLVPEPVPYRIEFSHYPSKEIVQDGTVRIHGHIHNNGYTRDAFVPFLKNHINVSVEQTHYKPVNLKLLLDGYLLGEYPRETEDRLEAERLARKKAR